MKKYQYANGYDFKKTMDRLKKYNNGTRCHDDSRGINACVYKDKSGTNRCFAGVFLPDKYLTDRIEGKTIDVVIKMWPNLKKSMPFNSIVAIQYFQNIHDSYIEGYSLLTGLTLYECAERWLIENVE